MVDRTLQSNYYYYYCSNFELYHHIQYVGLTGIIYIYTCPCADQIAERGERLELLVDKTEDLSAHVS